jgi:thiol-disulfide isomerase/thioredoxin
MRRPPFKAALSLAFCASGADRGRRSARWHRLFRFGALQAVQSVPAIRAPVRQWHFRFAVLLARIRAQLRQYEASEDAVFSPPLTASALRGKVVLIDFWTYTCINWLRTLPYVRAWDEKYRNQGLVVIGVHAPEFAFEKNINNVRWAVKEMRVDYPVAVDNEHVIWRAFKNQYWPAVYFIDSQGRVRHHHFGEGAYEQSEMIIQRLLNEAGVGGIGDDLVSVDVRGLEAAADWGSLPNGSIRYRFHARDLHLVMGPAAPGTSVRFRVLIDGRLPGAAHGGELTSKAMAQLPNSGCTS